MGALWKIFKEALELPKGEQYDDSSLMDISPPETENWSPTERKRKRLPLQYQQEDDDNLMFFEKGLHQDINRSESERPLTPYGNLLKKSDDFADDVVNRLSAFDAIILMTPRNQIGDSHLKAFKGNGIIDYNDTDVWFTEKGIDYLKKWFPKYYDPEHPRMFLGLKQASQSLSWQIQRENPEKGDYVEILLDGHLLSVTDSLVGEKGYIEEVNKYRIWSGGNNGEEAGTRGVVKILLVYGGDISAYSIEMPLTNWEKYFKITRKRLEPYSKKGSKKEAWQSDIFEEDEDGVFWYRPKSPKEQADLNKRMHENNKRYEKERKQKKRLLEKELPEILKGITYAELPEYIRNYFEQEFGHIFKQVPEAYKYVTSLTVDMRLHHGKYGDWAEYFKDENRIEFYKEWHWDTLIYELVRTGIENPEAIRKYFIDKYLNRTIVHELVHSLQNYFENIGTQHPYVAPHPQDEHPDYYNHGDFYKQDPGEIQAYDVGDNFTYPEDVQKQRRKDFGFDKYYSLKFADPLTYTDKSDVSDGEPFKDRALMFHTEEATDIDNPTDNMWIEQEPNFFPAPSNENEIVQLDRDDNTILNNENKRKKTLTWQIHYDNDYVLCVADDGEGGGEIIEKGTLEKLRIKWWDLLVQNEEVDGYALKATEDGEHAIIDQEDNEIMFNGKVDEVKEFWMRSFPLGREELGYTVLFIDDYKDEYNNKEASLKFSSDDPSFDDYDNRDNTRHRNDFFKYDTDKPGGEDALEMPDLYYEDLMYKKDTDKEYKERNALDWTGRENLQLGFGSLKLGWQARGYTWEEFLQVMKPHQVWKMTYPTEYPTEYNYLVLGEGVHYNSEMGVLSPANFSKTPDIDTENLTQVFTSGEWLNPLYLIKDPTAKLSWQLPYKMELGDRIKVAHPEGDVIIDLLTEEPLLFPDGGGFLGQVVESNNYYWSKYQHFYISNNTDWPVTKIAAKKLSWQIQPEPKYMKEYRFYIDEDAFLNYFLDEPDPETTDDIAYTDAWSDFVRYCLDQVEQEIVTNKLPAEVGEPDLQDADDTGKTCDIEVTADAKTHALLFDILIYHNNMWFRSSHNVESSQKLSWNTFLSRIGDVQEGDVITDDANDKYRIKEIDYDQKKILLEEVFPSGNFDGPFWVNEADMQEHGFEKVSFQKESWGSSRRIWISYWVIRPDQKLNTSDVQQNWTVVTPLLQQFEGVDQITNIIKEKLRNYLKKEYPDAFTSSYFWGDMKMWALNSENIEFLDKYFTEEEIKKLKEDSILIVDKKEFPVEVNNPLTNIN